MKSAYERVCHKENPKLRMASFLSFFLCLTSGLLSLLQKLVRTWVYKWEPLRLARLVPSSMRWISDYLEKGYGALEWEEETPRETKDPRTKTKGQVQRLVYLLQHGQRVFAQKRLTASSLYVGPRL